MSWIQVDRSLCNGCAVCETVCPRGLVGMDADGFPEARVGLEPGCMDCGHCLSACPAGALTLNGVGPGVCEGIGRADSLSLRTVERLVKGRRSVREYREATVPRETITWLLDVARWAPSAMNTQPVHWTVVDGRERVHALGGLMAEWMRAESRFPELVEAWDRGEDRILRNAPHLLLAHAFDGGIELTAQGAPADSALANPVIDCAIAAATVDIAAQAVGLGTCWAGFLMLAAAARAPFFQSLHLPKGHRVFAALMLGRPRYEYRLVPPRREARITWK